MKSYMSQITLISLAGCQCGPGYAMQGDMCIKESHCTCLDVIDNVEKQVYYTKQ